MSPSFEIFDTIVSSYKLFIVLSLTGYFSVLCMILKRYNFPKKISKDVFILFIISVYVGSKLYHLVHPGGLKLNDPHFYSLFMALNQTGSILMFAFGLWVYTKQKQWRFSEFTDKLVIPAPLAFIFARLACFMSADGCYGKPTDFILGIAFPNGTAPTLEKVHPIPLYESVTYLFLFILFLSKQNTKYNTIIFLSVFGLQRFLNEFIRTRPVVAFGLTEVQYTSMLFILSSIVLYHFSKKETT